MRSFPWKLLFWIKIPLVEIQLLSDFEISFLSIFSFQQKCFTLFVCVIEFMRFVAFNVHESFLIDKFAWMMIVLNLLTTQYPIKLMGNIYCQSRLISINHHPRIYCKPAQILQAFRFSLYVALNCTCRIKAVLILHKVYYPAITEQGTVNFVQRLSHWSDSWTTLYIHCKMRDEQCTYSVRACGWRFEKFQKSSPFLWRAIPPYMFQIWV